MENMRRFYTNQTEKQGFYSAGKAVGPGSFINA